MEPLRNRTDLATGQLLATTVPQQLNYVSDCRAGTKLTNLSNTEVWYGSSLSVSPTNGDLLAAGRGQWAFIPAQSVIFVVTASGTALIAWADCYE